MAIQPDIIEYGDTGYPVLSIEVKNKIGTDSQWASGMLRNMLAHDLQPHARYFLLALPDRFYLWQEPYSLEPEQPAYEVDASQFLHAYFEAAGVTPENLSGTGLELLLIAWLNELINGGKLPDSLKSDSEWLIESGLYDAIQNGQAVLAIAA